MAYLDDNNDNQITGGDPLAALDKELEALKATLGELEPNTADNPAPTEEKSVPLPKTPSADEAVQSPQAAPAVSADIPPQAPVKAPARFADKPKPSGAKRPLLIALITLLCIALIGGLGYGLMRVLVPRTPADPSAEPTASGERVTISDSVMGDIELQTVEGAKINTYTAENLVTEDGVPAYYENGKKISHLGVDLSEYQGEVDFAAMKAAGAEFVMLRLGGRYYGTEGGLYEDGAFDSYYEAAKSAGLKVGAYFFSQAASTDDAAEEAEYALQTLAGRKLDYPVAFDWENIADDEARTDNVTGMELTAIAEAFCDTITQDGYRSIVYSNTQQMFVMYDFETMKDYDFWLADYRDFPTMYYKFDMWQYTTGGTIDGVDGEVDLNLSFTDFD